MVTYFMHLSSNIMFLISFYDCHCDVLGAIRIKKKDGTYRMVISPLAELFLASY